LRRYSIFSLLREARRSHSGWTAAWEKATPKPSYDIVIVGGGGHGLATAYYLAKLHGIDNVAVVEKGWIGGGNTARNTGIIRSNYLRPESMELYSLSHSLFEHLSAELNFNTRFSPRGMVHLAHTRQDLENLSRTADANRHFGIKSWMIPPSEVKSLVPLLDVGPHTTFPLLAALWQPRGGIADHNAVAWAYARMAHALGVDIIEDCEVETIDVADGRVTGLTTSRGTIAAGAVLVAAAADSAALLEPLGVTLPLTPVPLQAFVSEPLAPVLDVVVLSDSVPVYVSQADKGELVVGGSTDAYPSYSRRGSFATTEDTASSLLELFPSLSGVRLMRHWAGTVDLTPDRSPLIGPAGPDGIYVNCGWGTGGFKAVPAGGYASASMLAQGKPARIAVPFGLDRFETGRLVDETSATCVRH